MVLRPSSRASWIEVPMPAELPEVQWPRLTAKKPSLLHLSRLVLTLRKDLDTLWRTSSLDSEPSGGTEVLGAQQTILVQVQHAKQLRHQVRNRLWARRAGHQGFLSPKLRHRHGLH